MRAINIPLAKGILVHREIAADPPEMQRLALFFEKVLTFSQTGTLSPGVDGAEIERSLAYLAEHGVVNRIVLGMPAPIDFGMVDEHGRHSRLSDSWRAASEWYIDGPAMHPYMLPAGVPHSERMRRFANNGSYRDAPIAVHLPTLRDAAATDSPVSVVEVTLRNIPLPAENTPWDEIIAFRNDPETQRQFRALRQWMRGRLACGTPADELQAEIDAMLSDFRTFMRGAQMSGRLAKLKAIVYTGLDIGLMLKGYPPVLTTGDLLFERLERGVPTVENDKLAPGREIAYLDSVRTRFAD
ncbi:MAG: hypothetical protein K8S21_10500 [Gemmatimonadetes bacterium]|nr:hypothetical protein [Gemmatimonadota bacterium]